MRITPRHADDVELATLAYFKWFNKYPLNSEFGDIRSSGRAINARAA
jgi:hypothetical protein